jgi:hypothetical protein
MKHTPRGPRTAAAALVAATGLVLVSAASAQGAPARVTTGEQLRHSILRAVALERAAGAVPLHPASRGVVTAASSPASAPSSLPC